MTMNQPGHIIFRTLRASCSRRPVSCNISFIRRTILNAPLLKNGFSESLIRNIAKERYGEPREHLSSSSLHSASQDVVDAVNEDALSVISRDVIVYENFVTEEEECSLVEEVEPYLKRLKYETSHWDDAIHGYRETERKTWTQRNKGILERIKQVAFPVDASPLAHVHVLDLMASGVIKPHIDSVRFCGNIVAGLSLLSQSVMRFVPTTELTNYADVLLPRRSLYIMRNKARYDYTHEVLAGEKSLFRGRLIQKERRIAVICRNEASDYTDMSPEQ